MGCGSSSPHAHTVSPSPDGAVSALADARMDVRRVRRGNTVQEMALHVFFGKHDRRNRNALNSDDLCSMMVDALMTANGVNPGSKSSSMPGQQDVSEMLSLIDTDGNAQLDRGEFMEWIKDGSTKSDATLQKYAARSRAHGTLVTFMKAVNIQISAYETGFFSLCSDEMVLVKSLHEKLCHAGGSMSNIKLADLKSIMLAKSKSPDFSIHRQDVIDFIVHCQLRSYYQNNLTSPQRVCSRQLIIALEHGIQHAKKVYETTNDHAAYVLALSAMFGGFDPDGDGVLDEKDMRKLLVELGGDPRASTSIRAEIEELISDMDTNGDGLFDENEFVQFMLGMFLDGNADLPGIKGALFDKVSRGAQAIDEQRNALSKLFDSHCSKQRLLGGSGMLKILLKCRKNAPPPLPPIDASEAKSFVANLCSHDTSKRGRPRVGKDEFVGRLLFIFNSNPGKRKRQAEISDEMANFMGLCDVLELYAVHMVDEERKKAREQQEIKEKAAADAEAERALESKKAIILSSDDSDDDDDDDEGESMNILSIMPKRAPMTSAKSKQSQRRAPMRSSKSFLNK